MNYLELLKADRNFIISEIISSVGKSGLNHAMTKLMSLESLFVEEMATATGSEKLNTENCIGICIEAACDDTFFNCNEVVSERNVTLQADSDERRIRERGTFSGKSPAQISREVSISNYNNFNR